MLHRTKRIRVEFDRRGWRKLRRYNRHLGARYLKAYIMLREVSNYIRDYTWHGIHFDTECTVIRYSEDTVLTLYETHGVWYITNVESTAPAETYEPVYFWKQIKRGVTIQLARMFICWMGPRAGHGNDTMTAD